MGTALTGTAHCSQRGKPLPPSHLAVPDCPRGSEGDVASSQLQGCRCPSAPSPGVPPARRPLASPHGLCPDRRAGSGLPVDCGNRLDVLPLPGTSAAPLYISSLQFNVVSVRSERPICAPPRLSEVSPMLPLKHFQCSSH